MVIVGITLGSLFQLLAALLLLLGQLEDSCAGGAIQDNAVNKTIRGGVGSTGGDYVYASDETNGVASRTLSSSSSAEILGSVDAVYGLIDRVLKDPKAKDSICLRIVDQNGERSSHQKPKQKQQQQQQQQQQENDPPNNPPNDQRLWFRLEQQERAMHQQFDAAENNIGCRQRYKEEDLEPDLDLHTSNRIIVVTATSASELTAGLGHYFKHYCNFTIEWSTGGRAGGSHIVLPEVWPVPLGHDKKTILRYRTTKIRYVRAEYQPRDAEMANEDFQSVFELLHAYLMNVCTHSYSLVWYDWTAWQSLIDNMALRGINMVLALTGQEEIQYKVFSKLGLEDQDIRSWFNGPAFLTWSRGQNEYGSGIAGPLPRSFMKSQWSLQREYILPRLRSLGIVGILPAFQGNVPIQLKALYNDTNITQQEDTGWMNSRDPLFSRIADLWMTEMIEDFGTDHYYQLDGWFNGGVPPWMNDNKQTKQKFTATATQRRSLIDQNSLDIQEPIATQSPIAHDEDWYRRGQAAYAGLNRTDPNAHWIYQGFAFVGWKTPEQASYVKGFVDSAPHGKFIVIDMEYSPDGEWQKWGNSSFFGAPFIWSKLHNFGDTSGLRGDMDHINSAFPYQALEARSSIIGIGGTPEGIDQNPLYYDFLYEQNFRPEPVENLTEYLIQLNHKRYGLHETDHDVSLAWTYLLKSSYSQDFNVQDLTAVAHLNPRPSGSLFESDRSTPKPILCDVYNAWVHLIQAAESMRQWTDPFLYDLVNVGREVLAQLSTPIALNFSDARSVESMNREELIRSGELYVELLLDLDRLLGTNTAFLLSPWLESARRLAQDDATGISQHDCFSPILRNQSDRGCCSNFYEFNARAQITTWNPTPYNADHVVGGPVDYAAKHWNGLIEGYYAKRASILLKQALEDQQNGHSLNSTEVERIFAVHAYDWTTSVNSAKTSFDTSSSLLRHQQNAFRAITRTSKEMLEKYSHWFIACQ